MPRRSINNHFDKPTCTNCKKSIHCLVEFYKDTNEAVLTDIRCKGRNCECKCRTYYQCPKCGGLHPYGPMSCDNTKHAPQSKQVSLDGVAVDKTGRYSLNKK